MSHIVPLVRPLPWLNVPLQPTALILSDAHCPAVSLLIGIVINAVSAWQIYKRDK